MRFCGKWGSCENPVAVVWIGNHWSLKSLSEVGRRQTLVGEDS